MLKPLGLSTAALVTALALFQSPTAFAQDGSWTSNNSGRQYRDNTTNGGRAPVDNRYSSPVGDRYQNAWSPATQRYNGFRDEEKTFGGYGYAQPHDGQRDFNRMREAHSESRRSNPRYRESFRDRDWQPYNWR